MVPLVKHPFRREIVVLFSTAMALFVFVVAVGILNGTDLVDFGKTTILAHVHAGTLGWITLAVFAATLWLFGGGGASPGRTTTARVLTYGAAVSVVAYAAAFLLTRNTVRPVIGIVTLAVMVGFAVWALLQAGTAGPLSVPRLGYLAALVTSVTGGVFGVLWGLMIATGGKYLPEGGEGAHPATMVVGFLVPVGMATVEWWLVPGSADTKATRAGLAQIAFPFAGGVLLMVGVLADVTPLQQMSVLLEIVGVVIMLVRIGGPMVRVRWLEPAPGRLFSVGGFCIALNIALLFYLVAAYAGDFDKIPSHLLLAVDHVMFVGVTTNAVFGFLLAGTWDEREVVWPWADQLVFWGLDGGLLLFVAGLMADTALPKRIGTPFMGAAILLGLATCALRLRALARTPEPVPAAA